MEPDVSIETSSMIRVAILPIGDVPLEILRDYASLLLRHWKVDLSSISPVYTENQKSPFAHQPWDSGSLRFKFLLGGTSPSPWEDFQSNRKTLAVIGICHCPSSMDLDATIDQFSLACKGYSSSLVQRCFAFCPNQSQLMEGSKKENKLILFPPGHGQSQEIHLQTMMRDIAVLLLMEFEKWVLQAESAGTILKTPLDSPACLSTEEVIKAKKRRLGRAQKTIGDYCLLAGSPIDANAHYSTALELARLTGDSFWYGGALEGSVCALLLDRMAQQDPILEEEVKYRYNSVIMHYKKSSIQDNVQRVSPLSFELEATLKLARFLCRRELAKEVVELLTNAADGAKSLIDANDRLILFIEIARLFGTLGYKRKAAFFSRQVAQLYLQQENRLAAISAMQVLAMTTEAYRVQSRASLPKLDIPNEVESSQVDGKKIHHQSVVSLYESQWSTLQMVVLREILMSSVRAGDPLTAWSAAARLLRSYYPLITPAGQNGLATTLSNSAQMLPPGTRSADPSLPFVRLHSFPLHSSQTDIVKRNPTREDWWSVSAPSGPFIYTPFSKGETNENNKQEMIWVVGEPIQVLVELANPCGFDLMVDSIYLSMQSAKFDAFPMSLKLPPNSSKVIMLSGIPSSVGAVTIPGCTLHCFGVITEHLFKDVDNLLLGAAQGIVLSDPFCCCGSPKLKNVWVPNIEVVPPLPLLVSHVVGGDGAMILYEGEIRTVLISFANAGTVPVDEVHVSVSGRNQDSIVLIDCEALNSSLPLKPGAQVTLLVTLKAWQLGSMDIDTAPGRSFKNSKDAVTPMLVIHYAGTKEAEASTCVGRRLIVPLHVCVLQGLSFVKAALLSMEIPSHVGENLPKAVHIAPKVSEKAMMIDPYKGSRGLRLLELELSNPTDSVFEICVCVFNHDDSEICYPKTRMDRDYCARVLIPLEHLKLPILDASCLVKNMKGGFLDGSIRNLISRMKVRWECGGNRCGEVDIKDATLAALQSSVMDVLLPEPLTFGFRVCKEERGEDEKEENGEEKWVACVAAHEMAAMEVLVHNNTREMIRMSLSIGCRDVAGHNCVEGEKATVLWSGVLNAVEMEVAGLEESKHCLCLCFLVPGEYTLHASAVIDNPNEMMRARVKSSIPDDDPIFCRGPPFHLRVTTT